MKVCCGFSFESPHRGDSNEYTQHTISNIKKNHPKSSQIGSYGTFFQGTQERVRNNRGKRAINVRVTEVLLYWLSGCFSHSLFSFLIFTVLLPLIHYSPSNLLNVSFQEAHDGNPLISGYYLPFIIRSAVS